jgi:choline dehydrogenase-like flavoprotein
MNRGGQRSSSAYGFVEPLAGDPRLDVRLRARVRRLIVEGTQKRVVGVEWQDKSGTIHQARTRGEVIVSAGALITPQLLLLSGIGPAAELARHGIHVNVDLPGVGENLIDHPEVPIVAAVKGPYGYFGQGNGLKMLKNGLQFKLFGSGPVTSAGVEAGAFVNPNDPSAEPTIQAFCVPIMYIDRSTPSSLKETYGLTVTTVVVKPKSRGQVRLRSADPQAMPSVNPRMLEDPRDLAEMIAGQRFFIRAFQAHPLAQHVQRVAMPADGRSDDDTLAAHCRNFAKTNYHPAGTCRMGPDGDPMAVLDSRLKVRGVEGLRVCDMSAVPDINAGNTAAPAMMLGARCADFILGRRDEIAA